MQLVHSYTDAWLNKFIFFINKLSKDTIWKCKLLVIFYSLTVLFEKHYFSLDSISDKTNFYKKKKDFINVHMQMVHNYTDG